MKILQRCEIKKDKVLVFSKSIPTLGNIIFTRVNIPNEFVFDLRLTFYKFRFHRKNTTTMEA